MKKQSYLEFVVQAVPKRKTKIVIVQNTSGLFLGRIAWYPPFRSFVFEPAPNTAFGEDCLMEIWMKTLEMIADHKNEKNIKNGG